MVECTRCFGYGEVCSICLKQPAYCECPEADEDDIKECPTCKGLGLVKGDENNE